MAVTPPRPTGTVLLLYTVLATLLTLLIVQYSRSYGRLLVGPLYDDVVYLNDGLYYSQVALTQGPRALVEHALRHPPHSPFATFVAGVSFLLFGPVAWAPYVSMGVAVLAVVLAADRLLAGLSSPARVAGALFVLTFPIVGTLPYHFRPDAVAGLAAGFGVVMMLRCSPLWAARSLQLWTGLWFAFAMVVKSPVLPFTLLMFGGSWLLSLACGRRTDLLAEPSTAPGQPRAERWSLWGALWPYALPALLLAGPYYALTAGRLYRYIYDQVFGRNRDVWVMDIDWPSAVRYVWDGQAGQLMLGRHAYLVLATAALSAAVWLWLDRGRFDRGAVRLVLAMLGALFLAWAVPTISKYGNPFTGSTFAALVMFGGVLLLRSLFLADRSPDLSRHRRSFGAVLAWGAVALAMVCFKGPAGMGNRSTESVVVDNRVERVVYRTIVDRAAGRPAQVFVTSAANLSADLLRFRALVDHQPLSPVGPPFSTDLDDYRSRIAASDFVVAGDQGAFNENRHLPFYAVQNELVAELESDPALELLATVPAHDGLNLYVFGRLRASEGAPATAGR